MGTLVFISWIPHFISAASLDILTQKIKPEKSVNACSVVTFHRPPQSITRHGYQCEGGVVTAAENPKAGIWKKEESHLLPLKNCLWSKQLPCAPDSVNKTSRRIVKLRIASCRPTHGRMRRFIPPQQGLVWPDKMHHFISVKRLALQKQPTEDKYWPALRPTEDSFNPFLWPSSEHLVEIYFFHMQMHNYFVVKLLKWLCLWVMLLGCANDLCPLVLITQA